MPIDDYSEVYVQGEGFTPFQVLSMNRVAFRDTFLNWRDSIWLAERKKVAGAILSDGENAYLFEQLKERVKIGGMVPFVGAGMSIPSGGRSWGGFLHQLRVHCDPPVTEKVLNNVLKRQGYEDAAELIITRTVPRLFDEKLEFYCLSVRPEEVYGAVRLLPMLFVDHGLTTNFDNILDMAYSLLSRSYDIVLKGREVVDWSKYAMQRKTMLLKIHGHASEPATRVLTRDEYNLAYAAGCAHRQATEEVLRNSALLFLGCSLASDRTMDLLQGIYTGPDAPMTRNYAILPMPNEEPKRRNREAFLADRGIFPIWYGGYGEPNDPAFDHDLRVESLLVKLLNDLGRIDELTVEPEEPLGRAK